MWKEAQSFNNILEKEDTRSLLFRSNSSPENMSLQHESNKRYKTVKKFLGLRFFHSSHPSCPSSVFVACVIMSLALVFISLHALQHSAPLVVTNHLLERGKMMKSDFTTLLTCPSAPVENQQLNKHHDQEVTNTLLLPKFYEDQDAHTRERLKEIHQLTLSNSTQVDDIINPWTYDQWKKSYREIKEEMSGWKESQFLNYVKSNMTIYESACGEGFNLLMTLSILHQRAGITNVTVYGNEYRPNGVMIANQLLQATAHRVMPGAHVGAICQGDSTQLGFVPSNSFDVAFTGYIDPLQDPYGFFTTDEKDVELAQALRHVSCKALNIMEAGKDQDAENADIVLKAKVSMLDQQKQEDWFASWVSELIRIVKPGGAIIVEQIALPICDNMDDWGGVRKEWWRDAITKYEWNVIESSLVFENMPEGIRIESLRYHVSMRKQFDNTQP